MTESNRIVLTLGRLRDCDKEYVMGLIEKSESYADTPDGRSPFLESEEDIPGEDDYDSMGDDYFMNQD